jgi:hypothetical protein
METKWFTYKITLRPYITLARVKDMLRYSGDRIIEKISEREFILRHRMDYEDEEHLKRRIKFFTEMVLGRWGTFGATVSDLTEIEKDD